MTTASWKKANSIELERAAAVATETKRNAPRDVVVVSLRPPH